MHNHVIKIIQYFQWLNWFFSFTQASASCACKLTGADVCGCSGSVVRPAPIKKPVPAKPQKICKMIGGVEPLAPIGDPCSCDSQLVVPAIPAPVPCTKVINDTHIDFNLTL